MTKPQVIADIHDILRNSGVALTRPGAAGQKACARFAGRCLRVSGACLSSRYLMWVSRLQASPSEVAEADCAQVVPTLMESVDDSQCAQESNEEVAWPSWRLKSSACRSALRSWPPRRHTRGTRESWSCSLSFGRPHVDGSTATATSTGSTRRTAPPCARSASRPAGDCAGWRSVSERIGGLTIPDLIRTIFLGR